jgi:hypothetical protein
VLSIGITDTWTINATLNDSITARVGNVGPSGTNGDFYPRIRVIRPDGVTLGDNFTNFATAAEVSGQAPISGTYTVLVSQNPNQTQTVTGNYILTVAKTAGPYVTSPDDEGGQISNGATIAG